MKNITLDEVLDVQTNMNKLTKHYYTLIELLIVLGILISIATLIAAIVFAVHYFA